jgi:hypothetical protein
MGMINRLKISVCMHPWNLLLRIFSKMEDVRLSQSK